MESTLIITGGILLGCLIGLSWFAGSDAPYVPTKTARIRKILKSAGLKKGDIFYELGSGDGRVALAAAKIGAISYGIEQSWIRILYSRWKSKQLASHLSSGNVKFIHGDIYHVIARPQSGEACLAGRQAISQADIIFIFLLPKGIEKLEPLLKRKLKKGSKVITQTFHFKNWKPYKKILITDKALPNTSLGKNVVEGDFWIYRV